MSGGPSDLSALGRYRNLDPLAIVSLRFEDDAEGDVI